MPVDKAELERLALELGGLFDTNLLTHPFRKITLEPVETAELYLYVVKRHIQERWRSRPAAARLAAGRNFRAVAIRSNRGDYIFFTIAAIEKIVGTMYGLMALPTFLPVIGDASQEVAIPISPQIGFPPFPLPLPLPDANDPVDVRFPRDSFRVKYAMRLATTALSFLALHEVGHHLAGHLDMRLGKSEVQAIDEFAVSVADSHPDHPPRRVLELDADAFAAHAASFLDMHPNMEEMSAKTFGWNGDHPKDLGFITFAVAISVLFRILSDRPEIREPSGEADYPHPAVRSHIAISRAFTLAEQAGRFSRFDLPRLLQRSLLHVESTWASLGFSAKHFDPRSGAALTIARQSDALTEEYENWKPLLATHARLWPRWHHDWPQAPLP